MNSFKSIITLLITTLMFSTSVLSKQKSYDEPIIFNSRYVKNPEKIIKASFKNRGWEIKDTQMGTVTGWLNNFKGNDIILEVSYNNSTISFKKIKAQKANCKSKKLSRCKINSSDYDRWRLYLRKTIALNIHTLAIREMLLNQSIKTQWLSTLINGKAQEKIKLARNIIDLKLFNEDALSIIESEIKKGYKKDKMTGLEIQQYAFYCKVLANSKDIKYIPLLKEVKNNALARKLKNYVNGYLKNIEPTSTSKI